MAPQLLIIFSNSPFDIILILNIFSCNVLSLQTLLKMMSACTILCCILIPFFLLVGTFPGKLCKKQLATFQKSSVQIQKMYQPKERKKLHFAVFWRVLHIQKVLVLNGRELTNSIIKEGVFLKSNEHQAGPSPDLNLSIHTTFSRYKAMFS
jgi:hypothetical protein